MLNSHEIHCHIPLCQVCAKCVPTPRMASVLGVLFSEVARVIVSFPFYERVAMQRRVSGFPLRDQTVCALRVLRVARPAPAPARIHRVEICRLARDERGLAQKIRRSSSAAHVRWPFRFRDSRRYSFFATWSSDSFSVDPSRPARLGQCDRSSRSLEGALLFRIFLFRKFRHSFLVFGERRRALGPYNPLDSP